MSDVEPFNPKTNIETWEITTAGTCWVWVTDPREPTGYKKQRVGGRQGGSKRLRINTDDRRYNQEQVVDEMAEHDPFRNGLLRLIDQKHVDDIDATYHLSNEDLVEMLQIKDSDVFREAVTSITSELIIRRLAAVAAEQGTGVQSMILQDIIDERYKIAKEQPAAREDSKGMRLS